MASLQSGRTGSPSRRSSTDNALVAVTALPFSTPANAGSPGRAAARYVAFRGEACVTVRCCGLMPHLRLPRLRALLPPQMHLVASARSLWPRSRRWLVLPRRKRAPALRASCCVALFAVLLVRLIPAADGAISLSGQCLLLGVGGSSVTSGTLGSGYSPPGMIYDPTCSGEARRGACCGLLRATHAAGAHPQRRHSFPPPSSLPAPPLAGSFSPAADWLLPGNPFEGYGVSYTSSTGAEIDASENNNGDSQGFTTMSASLKDYSGVAAPDGSVWNHRVIWSGTVSGGTAGSTLVGGSRASTSGACARPLTRTNSPHAARGLPSRSPVTSRFSTTTTSTTTTTLYSSTRPSRRWCPCTTSSLRGGGKSACGTPEWSARQAPNRSPIASHHRTRQVQGARRGQRRSVRFGNKPPWCPWHCRERHPHVERVVLRPHTVTFQPWPTRARAVHVPGCGCR